MTFERDLLKATRITTYDFRSSLLNRGPLATE